MASATPTGDRAPGHRRSAAARRGGTAARSKPADPAVPQLARAAGLDIAAWEHVGVIGKNRVGKTTLLRGIHERNPSVIVVCTRGRGSDLRPGDWTGFAPDSDEPEIVLYEPRCVVYMDPNAFRRDRWLKDGSDPVSRLWRYVWDVRSARSGRGGGVTVVIDEGLIACGLEPHPTLNVIIVQGMGELVGVHLGGQDAFGVYPQFFRNVHKLIGFKLLSYRGRAELDNNLELAVPIGPVMAQLKPRQFVYADLTADHPVPTGPYTLQDLGLQPGTAPMPKPGRRPSTPPPEAPADQSEEVISATRSPQQPGDAEVNMLPLTAPE